MGRKTIPGLTFRGGIWHIDKQVKGYGRICESTATSDRDEAETYLIHRLSELRKASMFGVRPTYTWRQAATRYLVDNQEMPSIQLTAMLFRQLDQYVGDIAIDKIHDDTLKSFVKARIDEDGVSPRTVNLALQRMTTVLRLAAFKWRDEQGLTWLEKAPLLTLLDEKSTRRPAYPLSWREQAVLFDCLPEHLQRMALYKTNTGCREQEVCKLQWDWEIYVPEVERSVFLIPWDFGGRTGRGGVKNGSDRLVVLNDVAWKIVKEQRGKHPEWVFPYEGRPLHRMNDTAWKNARKRAARSYEDETGSVADGFKRIRIHDLKHTFGRRLRAAGVAFEDRQVLLGHTSGSVTTEYSAAEIGNLIAAANRISEGDSRKTPAVTLIKRKTG